MELSSIRRHPAADGRQCAAEGFDMRQVIWYCCVQRRCTASGRRCFDAGDFDRRVRPRAIDAGGSAPRGANRRMWVVGAGILERTGALSIGPRRPDARSAAPPAKSPPKTSISRRLHRSSPFETKRPGVGRPALGIVRPSASAADPRAACAAPVSRSARGTASSSRNPSGGLAEADAGGVAAVFAADAELDVRSHLAARSRRS